MIIKMLLEESGQFFYCEARKSAPCSFEGIVHFLHKVGDGNAFVRGKTYTVRDKFDSRNDALTAAECLGKHLANQPGRRCASLHDQADFCSSLGSQGRQTSPAPENTAR